MMKDNKEANQRNAEHELSDQEVEMRLDQMSKRLDKLEALQEEEQRRWESLIQEIRKTRMVVTSALKA